jgi:hypothetical protein
MFTADGCSEHGGRNRRRAPRTPRLRGSAHRPGQGVGCCRAGDSVGRYAQMGRQPGHGPRAAAAARKAVRHRPGGALGNAYCRSVGKPRRNRRDTRTYLSGPPYHLRRRGWRHRPLERRRYHRSRNLRTRPVPNKIVAKVRDDQRPVRPVDWMTTDPRPQHPPLHEWGLGTCPQWGPGAKPLAFLSSPTAPPKSSATKKS